MLRNQNEEAKEEKVEPTLICRSTCTTRFSHVAALSDGDYFAAIIPAQAIWVCNKLTTYHIKDQKHFWELTILWPITAITLLKNNEVVTANTAGEIHRVIIKHDAPWDTAIFTTKLTNISAMTALDDRTIAIAHGGSSVSIWDLTTKKEIKSFSLGITTIHTMDTQCDGSLLLGNESGYIYIYNLKDDRYISHLLGDESIKSLVALPDQTIVFLDSDSNLTHYDPANSETLSTQKIDDEPTMLTVMANGFIACLTKNSLRFFEPSWTRDYVIANSAEAKNAITVHLPQSLTDIVLAYAGNLTLFNSPKMPHEKERVLTKELPTLKR